METKSRYAMIAEQEDKKRDLMQQKRTLDAKDFEFKKTLKSMSRQMEDYQETYDEYKRTLKDEKAVLDTMIESIDSSLRNLTAQK